MMTEPLSRCLGASLSLARRVERDRMGFIHGFINIRIEPIMGE